MVLNSTRWLALSYFTYFFAYGIFLPFWGVWLKGEGLDAETIGILLGAGMVARFIGSLLIAPRVKEPALLITALRILALLALVFAIGFYFGSSWAWLMLVISGFNLFFSPLVPLTDALANTWQKQFPMDYGRVRVWGSLAFVIGSAVTGELISVWGHQVILYSLIASVLAMWLGMLLKPSILPVGQAKTAVQPGASWGVLLKEKAVWRFLCCVTLLQAAHAGYYSFSAIYWQEAGYSSSLIGYLWSLGVVSEIIIFACSNRLFRHWTARDLLMLSAVAAMVRWGLMASTTALPGLLLAQLLHCGTFTICHLAAMRFISARRDNEIIRLQSVYSGLAMGGGIAVMTVITGFMFEHIHGNIFWVMALLAVPALLVLPPALARKA